MMMPSGLLMSSQRRGLFDANRERVAKALLFASAVASFLFFVTVLLWPRNEAAVIRVLLPKSRTILIQELPEIPPPASVPQQIPENLTVQEFKQRPATEAEKLEAAAPPKRQAPLDPDAGTEGRARANEATAALASATSALDRSLGDLTGALSANATEPARGRRSRGVRSGRSDQMLASVDPGAAGTSTALDGATVKGSQVAIGALESARTEDDGTADAVTASTASATQRSNASLLTAVQKYAAGIQYCYSNELTRAPGLRGKLVVALTVSAAGEVTDARILSDTMASTRLEACALSQIREWKFPAIAHGATTFQAPFVFTPP